MSAFKLPLARAVENPKNFSLPNPSHTNRFKWKEICVWASLVVPSFNIWVREFPKYWRTAVESDQCVDYLHGRWVWAKPIHVSLEPTGGPAKMLAVELHQSGGGLTLKHWEIVRTHIALCVCGPIQIPTLVGLGTIEKMLPQTNSSCSPRISISRQPYSSSGFKQFRPRKFIHCVKTCVFSHHTRHDIEESKGVVSKKGRARTPIPSSSSSEPTHSLERCSLEIEGSYQIIFLLHHKVFDDGQNNTKDLYSIHHNVNQMWFFSSIIHSVPLLYILLPLINIILYMYNRKYTTLDD
jgi:hypothetical protein